MQKRGLHFVSVGFFLVGFELCSSDSEFTSKQEINQTPGECETAPVFSASESLEGFGYHINFPLREEYIMHGPHAAELYLFPSAEDEVKQK